ncbi:hypothetical protein OG747_36700 [Streptomyces sp. NBC_01384]|uniref:hypothetical protein n=1 Tax=Streptomyces sp. NBC_01384 TaxID=2903847 RepID=UPI00325472F3
MSDQQPYPPQQPGWAGPQQPYGTPPFQPQPPKKKLGAGKIAGLGCLGIIGVFVILGAIGAAVGGSKTDTKTTGAKTNATTASSSPTPTPAKAAPAKPAHTSASKEPAVAATTHAPKKPSTAEARKKAAAILEKEDQDFRDFLAEGEPKVGTPQYTAWYDKAVVGLDMQQNAFKKADAYFTADNEPTDLLEAWRSDNGDGNAAITQFGSDGLSPDAPDAATRKDAADCLTALAKADKDAEKIANGS